CPAPTVDALYHCFADARHYWTDFHCGDPCQLADFWSRPHQFHHLRDSIMARVVHFEIQAEKPERAIAFYTKLFGWKFPKWEGPMPYWLITTGENEPGINGGLLARNGPTPKDGQSVNAYVCTVGVANLDESWKS